MKFKKNLILSFLLTISISLDLFTKASGNKEFRRSDGSEMQEWVDYPEALEKFNEVESPSVTLSRHGSTTSLLTDRASNANVIWGTARDEEPWYEGVVTGINPDLGQKVNFQGKYPEKDDEKKYVKSGETGYINDKEAQQRVNVNDGIWVQVEDKEGNEGRHYFAITAISSTNPNPDADEEEDI